MTNLGTRRSRRSLNWSFAAVAAVAALAVVDVLARPQQATRAARGWPAVTSETRPWTRWWWHGSAVDASSLTAQLDALARAGIGGVEVTPIYGVRGTEDRFLPFLSGEWMAMLEHSLREARRLGLGVDMATGTGWPFGGPWVEEDMAPRTLVVRSWTLQGGERLSEPVSTRQTPLVRAVGSLVHVVSEGAPGDPPRGAASQPIARPGAAKIDVSDLQDPVTKNSDLQALALEQVRFPRELPLLALVAFGGGTAIDLTRRVDAGNVLDWTAPPGTWTLHALFSGWHGKLVERAAPGGEGNVIDHFSTDAIARYLARFDRAFKGRGLGGLRAFFNDSYEVDDAAGEADWTPRLLEEFRQRRGYDLLSELPVFLGVTGEEERRARVLADYRETISELLRDTFTARWAAWAHGQRRFVRNQAHGSPANLLDLYAASDVPETEGSEIERFRWATSAAHVAGRRLVSAEAATWLGEHFRSTLADVRRALDRFYVAGVNHIVYHGTAYSPVNEDWPGWLFYASVAFSPQNAWWDDFAALNTYVTRVQSFLQSGRPDHDVLLYYPFYDAVARPERSRLVHFGGANAPDHGTPFERASDTMQQGGVPFDLISDLQVRGTKVQNGRLVTPGQARYRVLVLAASRYVPLDTFEHVLRLARDGATVLSLGEWPADVSGLADLDARRGRYRELTASVSFAGGGDNGIREARVGSGRILRGGDIRRLLEAAGIARERMVDLGLQFHRRRDERGRFYFVSNPGGGEIDGWAPVGIDTPAAEIFDPVTGRHGRALVRERDGSREVYLQMPAGGSILVAASPAADGTPYANYRAAGEAVPLSGSWRLTFEKGGPVLPAARTIDALGSWTGLGADAEAFAGTGTYTITFPPPPASAATWRLDLGTVRESARVRLNGRDLGTLFAPPFQVVVDAATFRDRNQLEISVTNLPANRIRDLDRRGVPWKKFYNVNFPARLPENRGTDGLFTASHWEPLESGLIGPVTLVPLAITNDPTANLQRAR